MFHTPDWGSQNLFAQHVECSCRHLVDPKGMNNLKPCSLLFEFTARLDARVSATQTRRRNALTVIGNPKRLMSQRLPRIEQSFNLGGCSRWNGHGRVRAN